MKGLNDNHDIQKPFDLVMLKKCLPHATDKNIHLYGDKLIAAMEKYEINTNRRQAAFIANLAEESDSLRSVEENLNYSAKGLLKTFPGYFNEETAKEYAHKPEKIANKVYANRMGNGDEASGDGWKRRGFGLIQTTGKINQGLVGKELGYDFIANPEHLKRPGAAAYSACFYWYSNNLNRLADIDAFERICIGITGENRSTGRANGIEKRLLHWDVCKKALNVIT